MTTNTMNKTELENALLADGGCDCDDGAYCDKCDSDYMAEMAFHEREYRLYCGLDENNRMIDVRTGEPV